MNKLCEILTLLFLMIPSCLASINQVNSSDLYASSTYSNLKISPNGKYVSAVFRDKKNHDLSLIDVDKNKFYLELALGLDVRLLSYHWLNDSQLLIEAEYESVAVIFVGTIFSDKIDVKVSKAKGYLVDVLHEQPDKIIFAKQNYLKNNDLYVVKIEDLINDDFGDAEEIEHNGGEEFSYRYDEFSAKITSTRYDGDSGILTYKTIPKTGGKWHTVLKKKIDDIEFKVVAILSSNYLAVLTNQQTDKVVLHKYNIKTQQLEEVIYQHSKYDLKNAKYASNGELSVVVYEENGLLQAEYFNPVSEQINNRLSEIFRGLEYFLVDSDRTKNKAILKVRGADQPGEYLLYDSYSKKLTRLLLSHPALEKSKLYKSKVFTTKSKDGVDIEGFLTSPHGKDSLSTLLVMPHGGPIGIKDSDRFSPDVQYFVSRGFSVLRVNFRGSDGFGKEFKEQGVGEFGKLIEEDITTVVNKVISEKRFKHVCSIGASYGGYSAVMLAIKHPELYKCVVGAFGIYDLPLLFNHDNYISKKENRGKLEKVVGRYDIGLRKFSPVYFAEKLKAPILLIAGIEDEVAVFEHTHRLAYMLKKLGSPVDTLYYENTGHGHSSWNALRHEAAIKYDFLLTTLGLPYPKSEALDDAARASLANDFSIIADNYFTNDNVKADPEKAFQFYKKAAQYDHPRSNFNVGSYYHHGIQVEQDIKQAIKYYQRAADLNNADAYRRLGRMYMEGEYFDINWDRAKELLEKGLILDDAPINYFRLARFDCTAPEKYRNIRRCLDSMKLKLFEIRSKADHKNSLQSFKEVVPWILTETQFTKDERIEFEDILNSAFKLNEMNAQLESLRVGSFNYVEGVGYGNDDVYYGLSVGNVLKNSDDENHYFGIIFDIDVPGEDRRYDSVGVAARWTKNMKNGNKKYASATVLYGMPKGEWYLLKKFSEFDGAESVTLDVFDLKGAKLLTQTFVLSSEE